MSRTTVRAGGRSVSPAEGGATAPVWSAPREAAPAARSARQLTPVVSVAPSAPSPATVHDGDGTRRLRVALYSHDAMGLGHVRRNLAIARSFAALDPTPDILLLTGAPEAVTANRPENCDLVALPALVKDADGAYGARHLSVGEEQMLTMRRSILTAALTTFRPDVLVVDKHPRGFRGELEPALEALAGTGTRVVLGLRDVLDDAETARREWVRDRSTSALRRWYDQVWVYGDSRVHDVVGDLDLPAVLRERVVHTGYLAHGRGDGQRRSTSVTGPYVLATVGGGADGAALAEVFARVPLPSGHRGVLVLGPQMPAAQRRRVERLAAGRTDLDVHTYVDDAPALLAGAAAVVAMGGYNTVCEAMARRVRLLVVPRVAPRAEQLVRARLLARAGMLDYLLPSRLSPAALGGWLARAVDPAETRPDHHSPRPDRTAVDLDGLARLPELLTSLVGLEERTDVA
ncbi:glycosyltransferase family protein [Georgenia subflava]|uniref:Glycosyl transferase family 28 n=1 Tax=Georgenia subflava TaxID=1622177 RepID=A0A6N7EH09_9MICO|nr:glycosyltransferase [Georgenia subflava]MPV37419.1 glycosyl transferase family 28 [Georgenia subflava]